jgi:hypothetical protein
MKLTTVPHLAPMLRMTGSVPLFRPLPIISQYGAKFTIPKWVVNCRLQLFYLRRKKAPFKGFQWRLLLTEPSKSLRELSGIESQFLGCPAPKVGALQNDVYRLLHKENKLGGACSTNKEEKKCKQNFFRGLKSKKTQDRPRCKRNDRLIWKENFM